MVNCKTEMSFRQFVYFILKKSFNWGLIVKSGWRSRYNDLATGGAIRGLNPSTERYSPLLQNVQNGSVTCPASYSLNIGDSFPGGKAAGGDTDYPNLSIAKVTNKRTYASTFPITILLQRFFKNVLLIYISTRIIRYKSNSFEKHNMLNLLDIWIVRKN